jgi:dTDP-4-dehydrorhamnose 3,5-epimerase-like enzyme
VATVRRIQFDVHADNRGKLVSLEGERNVPFHIGRVFYIFDIPPLAKRGGHAHRYCHQLLVAIRGSCEVVVSYLDFYKDLYYLTDPSHGLYIPPGVVVKIESFTQLCILMVLASEPYDPNDYVYQFDTGTLAQAAA